MQRAGRQGFTLIELSIVLVIIGLLVGGVLVGQTLIHQTRLLKVMTDLQKFVTACQTFQNQYNALPGDMPNATKYWGAVATPTNGNACYLTVGTGTQTCDGNGDGLIDLPGEVYRAWQHLQLAGLIAGSYTGVSGTPGAGGPIPGINAPKSPFSNADYELKYFGNNTGTASPFTGWGPINFGHAIEFGAVCAPGVICESQYGVITPTDAAGLDTKYDDGLPFSGIISAGHVGYAPNCATTPYTSASTYAISTSGSICSLMYVTGF